MRRICIFIMALAVLSLHGRGICEEGAKSVVALRIDKMIKALLKDAPHHEQAIPVAVLDFGASQGKAKVRQLGKAVAIMAQKAIAEDSRFTPVEREKLDKITGEIVLGQSGLINESQAKKAGDMLGAHLIITGNVAEIGEYFLVNGRVVDVGTAEVRANAGVEIPQQDLIAVSSKYVVVRKYSIVPAFQSAIIPGWGQIYNDQPKKAAFFVITGAASAATFGFSYLFYQNLKYDLADSHDEATQAYKKWQKYYQASQISMYGYAAVLGLAVIDAFWISHRNLKKYSQTASALPGTEKAICLSSNGLGVKVNLRF